eukprot:110119-Alexandrium_andersonii.AAC.1
MSASLVGSEMCIRDSHCIRHAKEGWEGKNKVTERPMVLHFKNLFADWNKRSVAVRRKLNKRKMEESAELAALAEARAHTCMLYPNA